mgnify:CR=1 FL=1
MSVSILLFLLTDAITQIALLAIVALRAYSRHSEFRADHHSLRHVHPEALASALAALDQKRTGDWLECIPFFNVLLTHPSPHLRINSMATLRPRPYTMRRFKPSTSRRPDE